MNIAHDVAVGNNQKRMCDVKALVFDLVAYPASKILELVLVFRGVGFHRTDFLRWIDIFDVPLSGVRILALCARTTHGGRLLQLFSTMLRNATITLRNVVLDVSDCPLQVPFLQPVVDAIARKTNIRSVVIHMRQSSAHDALHWSDVESDLWRLASEIHAIRVDCTGLCGVETNGLRIMRMSPHHCTIVDGRYIVDI